MDLIQAQSLFDDVWKEIKGGSFGCGKNRWTSPVQMELHTTFLCQSPKLQQWVSIFDSDGNKSVSFPPVHVRWRSRPSSYCLIVHTVYGILSSGPLRVFTEKTSIWLLLLHTAVTHWISMPNIQIFYHFTVLDVTCHRTGSTAFVRHKWNNKKKEPRISNIKQSKQQAAHHSTMKSDLIRWSGRMRRKTIEGRSR